MPPQVINLEGKIVSVWPGVSEELWCGEYLQKSLIAVAREVPRGN